MYIFVWVLGAKDLCTVTTQSVKRRLSAKLHLQLEQHWASLFYSGGAGRERCIFNTSFNLPDAVLMEPAARDKFLAS